MTMVTLDAVGLCAHPSPTGDRAFRYALSLAKSHELQLNVFTFLPSPWLPEGSVEDRPGAAREEQVVEADRRIRLYYEDRLKDFLDVGFRVCEGRREQELRRCLKRREYQVLVLPYITRGGPFGERAIEEFANHFTAPVVLVGPWRKVRYYLNPPAVLVADRLHLYKGTWRPLAPVGMECPAPGPVQVP